MNFNLVDDPWIPVRWADGRKDLSLVGLAAAFRECSSIAGLACAPHERVALTRLLVCAAQAAMG
ncbi:MAG: type I-E CRISPR-associated protein Cse1/CasA, partial [Akkermansiaceae bacterium]|nr:type I-E CRISPR-associated protein Cse1/CasA [Akkermansiaceae bacterium]